MFIKDGDTWLGCHKGRCWLLPSGKERFAVAPIGGVGRCWLTQVVEEGVGWYQVMRKAVGYRYRRQRKVLAVTGGKERC